MLLSAKNLSFSYLEENIIHQLSFHIGEQEKIALIGKNGVGKTTLFKLLMGELNPNSGEIYRNSGIQIGYLAQNTKLESDAALFDELYSANPEIITLEKQLEELATQMANPDNTEQEQYDFIHQHDVLHEKFERMHGYRYRSDVQGILQGLGFSEERYNQKVSTLSGGQKTRIALAKLLLQKPDLLLLDEPTNHLDLQAITWLEGFLADYPGALLMISHDRYFLDKVVRRVFHLTFGKIEIYEGNYSFYLQEKTIRHEIAEKSYANQQKELARQQNIIATLKARNREKFIKRAESREKLLEKMTLVEKPMDENEAMSLSLSPKKESGNDVLRIDSLTKSFDSLTLFQNLNLYIRKGERIALIGENGSGKTTLLRILLGKIPADSGEFRYGSQVMVSYYDQEHANLDEDKTIFDEISDTFPEMTQTAIRNLLAAFLFTGEDVFQKISSLSGGERGRLSLAKMMLAEGNFLLLDEPTNHLDLTSREVLENALTHYSGTLLFISHDRYFINQIATKVIELHPDNLWEYPGNYDYYLEKRLEKPVEKAFRYSYSDSGKPISYLDLAPSNRMKTKENPDNKKDWLKEKEEKSKLKKQQNYRKTLEEKIEQAEQRISDLEYLLTQEDIYTDYEKAAQISAEKDTWEETLLSYYTEIDSLS